MFDFLSFRQVSKRYDVKLENIQRIIIRKMRVYKTRGYLFYKGENLVVFM